MRVHSVQEEQIYCMKKLDEIVYFACLIVIFLLGFAGGALTVFLTVLIIFGKV